MFYLFSPTIILLEEQVLFTMCFPKYKQYKTFTPYIPNYLNGKPNIDCSFLECLISTLGQQFILFMCRRNRTRMSSRYTFMYKRYDTVDGIWLRLSSNIFFIVFYEVSVNEQNFTFLFCCFLYPFVYSKACP